MKDLITCTKTEGKRRISHRRHLRGNTPTPFFIDDIAGKKIPLIW